MGDDRDRVTLHTDHLSQKFLRQRQCFTAAQVARAEQPAPPDRAAPGWCEK
jgi:hypothetical protein